MEFTSTQLIIIVTVLTILILLPLLVILLVRIFIKDDVPADGEEAVSSLTEFTSIGDVWRAFVLICWNCAIGWSNRWLRSLSER
jgi:sec-independent protein translocase protein TatC